MRYSFAVILSFLLRIGEAVAIEVPYTVEYRLAEKPWEDGLGSCRAVVHVEDAAPAVRLQIPWRRHEPDPNSKAIVIVDAATNQRVRDFTRVGATREMGTLLFAPPTTPGDYFVYYLPYMPQPGYGNYS